MSANVLNTDAWIGRDFIGYGPDRPAMKWPNGASIAVNFVLNQEEGGERSVDEGDEAAETMLNESGPVGYLTPVPGERAPDMESQFEYGPRVAIWRIMKLFKKYNIPITFYAVARAFERTPHIVKYAAENGHEVACHCYRWIPYVGMTEAEEEKYIRLAVESFQKTTGKVPVGWYYGRPSGMSAPLVAKVYKELGHEFLYWADTYADDIPYWTPMPGPDADGKEGLVMMPYSLDNNDFKMYIGQFGSDDAYLERVINAFTTLREEGLKGKPCHMSIPLHTRWMGRPGRFQTLKRIVEHIAQFDDVWFATREDIARNFKENFPYKPDTPMNI